MDKEDVGCVCVRVCVCTHYLAIKNEIMPFEATWMDLEIIRYTKVSQRKITIICYHMWNIKCTDELISKTCLRDSQT